MFFTKKREMEALRAENKKLKEENEKLKKEKVKMDHEWKNWWNYDGTEQENNLED